jgi:FAD-dependent oxidoreductase domain-containing protein 1
MFFSDCGAKVELLTAKRLKYKFPWLNTDGIALGSYGYENEGWFDPWSLLSAFKLKGMELGVDYIQGEVYNIAHEQITDRVFEVIHYKCDFWGVSDP